MSFNGINGFTTFAGVGFSLNPIASITGTYNGFNDNTPGDYKMQVNWGDSTHWNTSVSLVAIGNSIVGKASHIYQAQGTYAVTVVVTGPDGQTTSDSTISVMVNPLPAPASRPPDPPAIFAGAEPLGSVQLSFNGINGFNAIAGVPFQLNPIVSLTGVYNGSFDNTAGDYKFQANCGDSPHWDPNVPVSVNGQSIIGSGSHTYAAAGTYPVTVVATGPDGQTTSSTTISIFVSPNTNPVATKLIITTPPPVNDNLGGTFGLAVSAEDNAGHVVTTYSGNVTIALSNNPSGAVLGGQTMVTPVNGVATFSGLTLNKLALGDSFVISSPGLTSATFVMGVIQPPGDYTFTGRTEPALFRRSSAAQWFIKGLASGRSFGSSTLDVPITGDFDGDHKVDLAVYRPSTAQWYVQESSTGYVSKLLTTYGAINLDVPVPGNYYGSGTTVPAVYRPTTGQWFVMGESNPIKFTTPLPGDIPVPGDYDNIGRDELAIYRPSTSQWIILGPTAAHIVVFGGPTDVPVPGAYNATATNHAVEPAVWRPSTGRYFIRTPSGTRVLTFGVGDIPMPGDFDGIGLTEAAVYRRSAGQWIVAGPQASMPRVFTTYGGPNDIPTGSPYRYRAVGNTAAGIRFDSIGPPVMVDLGTTAQSASAGARPAAGASLAGISIAARSRPAQALVGYERRSRS
jgi:PKD repeat protein